MGRRGERQRTLADYLAVGLGRVPDADVARALGVTHAAPCLMRRRHGICLSPQARAEGRRRRDAARHRTGAELRAAFSAVYLSAGAGRDRDHVVAARLGVARNSVADARRRYGIPSAFGLGGPRKS